MTTETMTVHKALAERKTLESRINSAIVGSTFVNANRHSNEKIDGLPIADYEKTLQGAYDKVSDLIKRQEAINRAVTLSNAVTKVKIGDNEYTVAEAIWMKNHGMEFCKSLMNTMKRAHADVLSFIERKNGKELEERAEKYVIDMYGMKESKTSTDDIEKTRKSFIENHTYDLIDPIHVADKNEELEKKINEFLVEVDSALSVSNAVTEIAIEY